MATTSWAAIRANMVSVIRAISPTTLSNVKFDLAPERYAIAKWAAQTGSGALRKFELTWESQDTEANKRVHPASQIQRNEKATITIAYPSLPALYGTAGLNSLGDVIREDAQLIYVSLVSPVNYLSGQHCCAVDMEKPTVVSNKEGLETLRLQKLSVELIYDEAT